MLFTLNNPGILCNCYIEIYVVYLNFPFVALNYIIKNSIVDVFWRIFQQSVVNISIPCWPILEKKPLVWLKSLVAVLGKVLLN